jgi:CheY-like chemotaxis protein
MAQVVSNILDNATKFTPPGGKIFVGLTANDDDAVLRIVDTGIGIAAENLERMFDLFTQLERGSGGRGLGIGLALVRRLLELHGGSVSASSAGEGQGTEIVVRLPCLMEPQVEVTPVVLSKQTSEDVPIRYLLVDDNADAANTLAELLEMSGCHARAAYSGEEATRVGDGFEPDIVLLDLGMPVMDGFEAAKRVRQTPWGSRAKLVAVTGWGQASDRKKTADAGFDGHLVKPVDLDVVLELAELVER